jgi:predicted short-subunit dehydrogenase-like oxidoreductase (DUF2520 family)
LIDKVNVIGARGRVGSALSARLAQRGVELDSSEPGLVLICVPDRAIHEVAAELPIGPWVAHTSGATALDALIPHSRRFGLHPLQTFTSRRGPEQLDDAWAAVTAETDEAAAIGTWLAELLGLRAFRLDESRRALYHAGAAVASNDLVTLRRAAGSLLATAGVPPEALDPLMRQTIANDFELTGPIARGDWVTVERHREAIGEAAPALLELYDVLAAVTAAHADVPLPYAVSR